MCDAISGYIEVESGAILAAHPASHSGTVSACALVLDQRERYSEWEWQIGAALEVRHTDPATARRLVSSITARFPAREALREHCRPQWERAGNYLIESQADADRIPADVPGDVICTLATADAGRIRLRISAAQNGSEARP